MSLQEFTISSTMYEEGHLRPLLVPATSTLIVNTKHLNKDVMEEDKQYVCGICYRQFTYNYTLRKHVREKHPGEAPPVKERKGILCPLCTTKLNSSDFYLEHLTKWHDVALEKEKLEFNTPLEFYEWKKGVESNHRYVQSRGGRTQLNGFSVTVYECHRSGMYVARGEGKRKLKNQGSKKINGLCPAKIKASISETGIVTVEFIKTHVGHDSGEQHILLNTEEKSIIVAMIKTKATFDEIIENLRKKPDASKRLKSVTKKDLHNIVCSYKLKDFVQKPFTKRPLIKKCNLSDSNEESTEDIKTESNKLNETITVDQPSSASIDSSTQELIFFPNDQNLITENIFIFGLTESSYIEELAFEKEKHRLKNIFLDTLDTLSSREQLEAVKTALAPFMPSLQSMPASSNTNPTDGGYNFTYFIDDKSYCQTLSLKQ